MGWFVLNDYVDAKTLDWVTKEDAPHLLKEFVADMLVDALGINGSANVFCKCKNGGYNLSWVLENGDEYMQTFSEEELLNSLKGKIVDYSIKIRRD